MKRAHIGWEKIKETLTFTFRPRGFQAVITFCTTFIALLTILILATGLYVRFSTTLRETTLNANQQLIGQVSENLERYLEEMHNTSILIEEILSTRQGSEKEQEVFHITHHLRTDVETVAEFAVTGRMRTSSTDLAPKYDDFSGKKWFEQALAAQQAPCFSAPHVQDLFVGEHDWVITYSREIRWMQAGEFHSAVLLVDMNFNSFQRICSQVDLGRSGYLFLINSNGEMIYHPKQQMIYSGMNDEDLHLADGREDGGYVRKRDGVDYAVNVCSVDFSDWKIVSVASMSEALATGQELWMFTGIMAVFAVVFVFFISIQVAGFVASPIRRLQRLMRRVENGVLTIRAPERGAYEIRELSKSFNAMIEKICSLMDEVIEEKDRLRKSEIRALQAQINPHFLYNTLDSIVWLAETGEKEEVVTMVTSLASLLRITISRGDPFVTVKEELNHAQNYLIIQKIRYGDRFDFSIQADEDLLHCRTVRIVLQPLIENAISHGIEPMEGAGHIRICVSREGDRILMQVTDNGVGMEEEKLRSILQADPEKASGIGVKNVNERIRLCCGEEYGLQFISRPGEGTTVRIWLPGQL